MSSFGEQLERAEQKNAPATVVGGLPGAGKSAMVDVALAAGRLGPFDYPGIPDAKPHAHVWTGGKRHGGQLRGEPRERTIDMLIASDDAYCRAEVCYLGRDFGRAETLAEKALERRYAIWTVDHLGGATEHWFDLERLTHWYCNNQADKQHRSKRHSSQPSVCVEEGARAPRPPVPTRRDGYSSIKNAEAEPVFRHWVFEYLLKHRMDPPVAETLIDNGAELVGASVATVERWLRRMTATIFGCLDGESENDAGQKVVQLKVLDDYRLTADQLAEKYPWAGSRFTRKGSKKEKQAVGVPS